LNDINNVVWIPSYPKSGNTWVHSVLKEAGNKYGFPNVDLDVYNLISEGRSPEPCPIVNGHTSGNSVAVLKTHSANSLSVHSDLNLNVVGYCHVIRNPLDTILSYINFSRIQYPRQKDDPKYAASLFKDFLGFDRVYSIDEWKKIKLDDIPKKNLDYALKYFSEHKGEIPSFTKMSGDWFSHAEGWYAKQGVPNTITLRYEDLLSNDETFLSLKKIFNITDSDIMEAINVVKNRTNKSKKSGGTSNKSVFYNKMQSYYFSNYFSENGVRNFLSNYEVRLENLGYSDLLEFGL
jgi:hypothetical protein